MQIIVDDLRGPEIAALLEAHLDLMRSQSPPESVHALDLEALVAADHGDDEGEDRRLDELGHDDHQGGVDGHPQQTDEEEAEVLADADGWYQIRTSDGGVSGWIFGKFLQPG